MTIYLVNIFAQMVGHHHLDEEAEQDKTHTLGDILIAKLLLRMELVQQVARAFNGARDQLWEEHHIERIIAEMPFSLLVAAIHLDDITHALEGVERQSDG